MSETGNLQQNAKLESEDIPPSGSGDGSGQGEYEKSAQNVNFKDEETPRPASGYLSKKPELSVKFESEDTPPSGSGDGPGKGGDGTRLSAVSQKYDLNKKGYLDETEKKLRSYDVNNDGTLDLHEAYRIVQEVQRQQVQLEDDRKKILNMKKIIVVLVIFTLFLTFAMLGVSFAAAILAKDTRVNPATESLTDKTSGETLGTVPQARLAGIDLSSSPSDERGRNRGLLSSISPLHRNMKRKIKQRKRDLIRCRVGKRCNKRDDDDDSGSNRNGVNTFIGDDICNNFEGTISRSEFNSIRSSFRRGEYAISLEYEDNDLCYMYLLYYTEGVLDKDNDVLELKGSGQLYCGDAGFKGKADIDDCKVIQDYYKFDCSGNKCDVYTCVRGLVLD